MFEYGSNEAKRELVSLWFKDNKFFTNANALDLSDDELKSYIALYFKQPKDVAKLHMVDLKTVIEVLIYQWPIWLKFTSNLAAYVADVIPLIIGVILNKKIKITK